MTRMRISISRTKKGTRLTGRVLRFGSTYGFIAPDNGGDDVFVHANELHCKSENKSLAKDSKVEFEIVDDKDGKKQAIKVTGPNGAYCVEKPVQIPSWMKGFKTGTVISFDEESKSGIIKLKGSGEKVVAEAKDIRCRGHKLRVD